MNHSNNIGFWDRLRRYAAPAAMIALGVILIFNPDAASALIGKLLGWALFAAGICCGVSASSTRSVRSWIWAALLVLSGIAMISRPLQLARNLGRIVGILLALKGGQDLADARRYQRSPAAALCCLAVGIVLIVLPLTASRLFFSACGLVTAILGIVMLLNSIRGEQTGSSNDDPNIIDAL